MIRKITYLFILFLLTVTVVNAQDNSPLARARKLQRMLAYHDAIPLYKKALEDDSLNKEALRGIAECYRMTAQTEMAAVYYLKLVGDTASVSSDKFRTAQVLMSNGDYPAAKKYFNEYIVSASGDERAKNSLEAINRMDDFLRDSTLYSISDAGINTDKSEFSPALFANSGYVFVSSRETGSEKQKTHSWTGDPFLSLFFSKGDSSRMENAAVFATGMKSDYNDGPVAFSSKGDEMFLTRNNSKLPGRNDKTSRLKIVVCKLKDGKWMDPAELPFNRASYNIAHACLSVDGNRLYFSSDMPGGRGGMDLWYCDRTGETWSDPVNLGAVVNTSGNEVFPFISTSGELYFSSDALPGLGGLDVFKIPVSLEGLPLNMGYPINTHRDDFGVWVSSDGKHGYLSSNRKGGKGDDDIYRFSISTYLKVYGIIAEMETKNPIPDALVYLLDYEGNKLDSTYSDGSGNYSFNKLKPETDYKVTTSPVGYFSGSDDFTTKGIKGDSVEVDLYLNKMIIDKPIVLENIYYDLDKSNIRPDAEIELNKLIKILKDNPTIVIELGSHTDCRASNQYNMLLSDRRAKSAANYIIKKGGIGTERITGKGYGESMLINRCKDGVKCTESEHQQNRRTEFKVISR